MFDILSQVPLWALYPFVALALFLLLLIGNGLVFIPNDGFGVVERRWALRRGRSSGFMALGGGPGFLPDTIKGGWHAFVPFHTGCIGRS